MKRIIGWTERKEKTQKFINKKRNIFGSHATLLKTKNETGLLHCQTFALVKMSVG